ncbi:SH3 domain-containing protein [Serpentinicella alkaliphila]|uniref:Cell wall-associated NlpC family hydrolase n=1 Tax=Serpentinicella alkaliphila TaxID=1734049 RepID=A0A4R2TF96_9FIRM|nr:SH3 domain-containing protein [Serpentinicella alkaliphila]QUH26040.1 SH3 domain-containing protein [Serpentinicella alkaliphila]TCP99734.1 cell wall-associated NlpC family hydrolase [Serpentinicella alkaliphila]
MKKNKSYFVALFIALTLFSSTTIVYGKNGTNIAKEGLVRQEPNFESEIKKVITLGEQLFITEVKDNWYKIDFIDDLQNSTGWIYRDSVVSDYNKEIVKIGKITTNVLNVRSGPSTDTNTISSLSIGEEVTIIGINDIWYQVFLKNGVKGWIHGDFVEISETNSYPSGKVVSKAEVKTSLDAQSKTLVSAEEGTKVYIKDYNGGWFNILFNDVEGWVDASSVEIEGITINSVNRSGKRSLDLSNIGTVASKYIGTPYRYGSTGPNSFDCSGFVTYIFNQYYSDYLKEKQVRLPRSSRDMATIGMFVSKSDLGTGDLVFFNNGSSRTISHVGIYIGDGKFIHSATSGRRGIVISSLNEAVYTRTYAKAVRI